MTGTGTAGSVGERAIYDTNTNNMDALVTAGTVNTAVTNAVNGSLIRVDETGAQNPNGTLWEIQDDLVALNICSNYTNATGTGVQNGTPTPTNPILPTFYQQGDMILRAVGTYADSYDVNTNKITRRVGVKVLDGTEEWVEYGSSIPGLIYSNMAITNNSIGAPITSMICSHLQIDMTASVGEGKIRFQGNINQNQVTSGRVYMKINSSWTLAQTTQWLADQYAAGTPVVVYYPLETPVTEDMPPRCQ